MAEATLAELEEQIEFLASRITTMRSAISSIHGSLVTGSVFARINGAILIPDSVDTTVIAPDAITVTEIDDDAVTTPKIIAGAVIANKLAAQIILGTEIVAGSYSDPDYNGVRLDSTGLRLYDGGGNQRGLLSVDGSGWLGSSGGFSWDTSGNLSAEGLTVGSAASPGQRVEINSTGLEMYNSSNQLIWQLTGGSGQKWWNSSGATQRGEINVDGSGWFGVSSSEGLLWDSSGNVTMTGATFRSGATTAKLIVDSSGIKLINSSGATTGQLDTDGSFWFGGTNYSNAKLKMSTASSLIIDASTITVGNLSANRISTGTLNVDNMTVSGTMAAAQISGGTLGGGFSLGSGDITVNSSGKIKFGTSSADYLANNKLHFEVGDSQTGKIEFRNGASTPYAALEGRVNASQSWSYISAYDGSDFASVIVNGNSTASRVDIITEGTAGGDLWTLFDGSGLLITSRSGSIDYLSLSTATNRPFKTAGRIYPGTGTGFQSSRYIYDNGSATQFVGEVRLEQLVRFGQSATSGGSGALPSPTRYLAIKDSGGATVYIPCFSAFSAWAA